MAVPTFFRTWQFKVNNLIAVQATNTIQSQLFLFAMMQSFLGTNAGWTDTTGAGLTPAGNWTCVGSSNGVTAGLDGVNRWVASTNIIFANAGLPHSWFVYQHPTGPQICIDICNVSAVNGISIVVSLTNPFTGGTILNRPTAVGEDAVLNNAAWGKSNNTAMAWHMIRSTLGDVYLLQCANGWATNIWVFSTAIQPVTNFAIPFCVGVAGSSLSVPATTSLNTTLLYNLTFMHARGNTNMLMQPTIERVNAERDPFLPAFSGVPNSLSGEFGVYPWGLTCATAPNIGRMAQVPDIWAGELGFTDGNWYGASAANRAMVQWGLVVTPWNQSVPALQGGAPSYIGVPYVEGLDAAPIPGGGAGARSQLLDPHGRPYGLL